MIIPTKKISSIGLLIAMSIILTRVASIRIAIGGVEGIRIGFGKLPIILGCFTLGPFYGVFIGVISDIVGYIIQPIGPYMPHFTIISSIYGMLPILIFNSLSILGKNNNLVMKLVSSVGITVVVADLFLTPYALHLIFDIPWKILMIPRYISVPVTIFIYTYIINIFIKRKVINFYKAHHEQS